jgi:hypothetical protein
MGSRIEKALDKVRPAMRADGSDARIVECDETSGSVSTEMLGVCGRRHLINPARSAQTMRALAYYLLRAVCL